MAGFAGGEEISRRRLWPKGASPPMPGAAKDSAEARRLYPVNVEETNIAGVRTDVITPLAMPEANRGRVLINLHGGGFVSDSGSLIEGIPIANLAKIKVVSVYYRLAPENPFPAAVDDVVAVYKELLKTYKPRRHRDFRHVGGSHSDLRGDGPAQTAGTSAAGGARSFLGADRFQPSQRLAGNFRAGWISRAVATDGSETRARRSLSGQPRTARTRCCLRCSRTLGECLRPCWSPARAICC